MKDIAWAESQILDLVPQASSATSSPRGPTSSRGRQTEDFTRRHGDTESAEKKFFLGVGALGLLRSARDSSQALLFVLRVSCLRVKHFLA